MGEPRTYVTPRLKYVAVRYAAALCRPQGVRMMIVENLKPVASKCSSLTFPYNNLSAVSKGYVDGVCV